MLFCLTMFEKYINRLSSLHVSCSPMIFAPMRGGGCRSEVWTLQSTQNTRPGLHFLPWVYNLFCHYICVVHTHAYIASVHRVVLLMLWVCINLRLGIFKYSIALFVLVFPSASVAVCRETSFRVQNTFVRWTKQQVSAFIQKMDRCCRSHLCPHNNTRHVLYILWYI